MRAKWPLLLKVQLLGLTGINKVRKSDDARVKRRAVGALAALILVGAVLLFYVVLFSIGFCEQGLGDMLPAFMVAISSLIVFFFTLFQGCPILFATKDRDLVLALPVSKREIIFSRLLCSYLSSLAFVLAVALPATVVYFVYQPFSAFVVLTILFSVLFAPILPLILGVTLSTLIYALTAKLRHKAILQSIFSIALFIGIMIASFSISFSMGNQSEIDMGAIGNLLIGRIYYPALFIQQTLTNQTIWGLLIFLAISIAAAILFILIVTLLYNKIESTLQNRSFSRAYRAKEIRSASAMTTLVKKEFKRLLSSPAYLLNSISGDILMLLASFFLLFFDPNLLNNTELSAFNTLFQYAGAGLLILFIGTSCPSACALSLEGNTRGLLFSMPLSARKILMAKAVPTFVFNFICAIVFSIFFCVKIQVSWVAWLLTLFTAFFFSVFIALAGSFLNYKFPKYDWTKEIQVIKNSAPLLIMVFGSMIIGIACCILTIYLGPWPVLTVNILAILSSLLIFLNLKHAKLYI